MKKFIIFCLMFAMTFAMSGLTALATTNEVTVVTGLTKGTGTGTAAPIIKAKWEMKDHILFSSGVVTNMADMGKDDSTAAHTQIAPSGVFEDYVPYTICAVVTDQGIDNANISSVAAFDILYPGVAFHSDGADEVDGGPASGASTPQGATSPGYDHGVEGCEDDMTGTDEIGLTKLTKDDGYALFCDKVQNGNTNLPWFYDAYDYNEICDADGELMENHAFVYCGISDLYYEDPAGDYTIKVKAQVTDGQTDIEVNTLQYLELQSFDVDFDN